MSKQIRYWNQFSILIQWCAMCKFLVWLLLQFFSSFQSSFGFYSKLVYEQRIVITSQPYSNLHLINYKRSSISIKAQIKIAATLAIPFAMQLLTIRIGNRNRAHIEYRISFGFWTKVTNESCYNEWNYRFIEKFVQF